jgi:hypothetical protein
VALLVVVNRSDGFITVASEQAGEIVTLSRHRQSLMK